ncbi:MAG TPA: YihY/virulence factor BrkB family protein [Candidatus Acidoferrales bacterium]|nr:YihY/virulence factor BrkB family protein [Candidatus Acidoferrales bacterium]
MSRKNPSVRSQTSLWKLAGFKPWRLARSVGREIQAKQLLGRASELAFDFLFALFPLILFMMNLFGLFASRRQELQYDFLSYFADFLPKAAFELLRSTTLELKTSAGGAKLTIGIVLALWFASSGVSSIISALNLTHGVTERRSWVKVRIVALALTLALSILLFAALILVLASSHFLGWLAGRIGIQPAVLEIWKIAQWPSAIVFVLIGFSLIYFFGPDLRERRWHWITPGSAFGTLLWLLVSVGFRVYLQFYNSYSYSYGSLGAVMILLAWLYIGGLALLVGGEIDAQAERAINGTSRQAETAYVGMRSEK